MKNILSLILITGLTFCANSQNWQELLIKGETDFSKIQDAFYADWEGKQIERGSGYKQFKRWEHRMLPRLVNGNLPQFSNSYFERINEGVSTGARRMNEEAVWTSLGPTDWTNGPNGYNPGIGRVNCIDIHPTDPNTLFVGTPGGGLWKSTNGGDVWVPVFEDLTVLGVSDFYINPANTDEMYLLTGDADGGDTNSIGMMISTNGGESWETSGLTFSVESFVRNYRMIVDPTDSDIIFIAGNNGLLRSSNGGDSWTTVVSGTITDVEFKPGDPSIVYASNYGGAFYRSVDGGDNWSTVKSSSGLGRTAIGVSVADPTYVYMLASLNNSRFGGVYKSTDSGESIALQSDSPNIFGYSETASDDRGQGNYDLAIAVNPENPEDIYVSGIHIWNSTNGGQTWQDGQGNYGILNYWVYDEGNVGNYVHADNHTLDFLNGNLYAGSDGGIWKSSNLGASWTDLSPTLNNTQFYRLGQDPNDATRIVAGAQDNGSNIRTSEGWIHLFGADGMEALIDHEDGSTVYTSYQFGGIIRYSNNVANANITSNLMNTEGVSGGWITPYTLDPDDSDIIYLGLEDIWKSDDQGSNWTKISSFNSGATQLHLAVAESNTDYIYTTTGWSVRRTKNGGSTWQSIGAGLPSQYMTYLAVSQEDPETIWATFSGYAEGEKVYMSTNAGDTWENISDGLPNIPANCIVHLKGSGGQLFAGTDIGVYQKEGTDDWEPWFEGLPNVEVAELEIHYGTGSVRAATYGRGIWQRPIENQLLIFSIAGDKNEILQGESIEFSSVYSGEPESILWTFEGGSPSTSTDENPTVVYSDHGSYDVKLELFGNNTPSLTETDYVTVYEEVMINNLTVTNDNPTIGDLITFGVENDGEATSWSWIFEGGQPSTSTYKHPDIRYYNQGTFDVTVEVSGINDDVQVFEDFITVLLPLEIDAGKDTSIRPTVSSGYVTIDLEGGEQKVEILNASGKLIFAEIIPTAETHTVDFKPFEPGVYFIRIIGEAGLKIGRVIKK